MEKLQLNFLVISLNFLILSFTSLRLIFSINLWWATNGVTRSLVLVSFESGSWVEFKLGYRQDEEYMFKKFDATVDALKGMDLLNHFNEQK